MANNEKERGFLTKSFLMSKFLLTVLWKIIILFGLWIPLIYIVLGGICYLAFSFNPFDFSFYSKLYLSGGIATIVCSFILSVKNIIYAPVKNIFNDIFAIEKEEEPLPTEAVKTPSEIKKEYKLAQKLSPPTIANFDKKPTDKKLSIKDFIDIPDYVESQTKEQPNIYFSKTHPELLIHQYSDRFEVYEFVNDEKILSRIEYR